MQINWLKKTGWIYLPVNARGFVITTIAIELDVWFFYSYRQEISFSQR